ncbi:hypothetical protein D0Z08_07585 [Nocardioides immobilis]|uniref:CARDB domain-containing protein n=1 Tax=Nocardioides immobilis TaxID=2049295 RepID=A0A417Y4E6_9ACTN|nr:CARDB domain-containing protein [Nocardioides immobilis]RHW27542.1 hypothetical protein D0Z08_07585 [Nocardioides immobilis]
MRRTTSLVLTTAMAVTALAALPDRAAGAGTPNLTVSRVVIPAQATVGGDATFRVTVRNTGTGGAGASKVRLYLSNDGRRDRKDVALGTVGVGRIGAGAARTVRASFTIPAEVGPHRVVACADATTAVRETSERDNCRVTRATIWIWPKPKSYVAGTPDPRAVTTQLGSATAKKVIGPTGGSIALGAGGDTFILDVPPHALASTVEIALRPITSVDGLGMSGGLLAGVDLAPDGLSFLRPVTLTIVPDRAVALARQAGFAYQGDGTDLHAYGLERGEAIVMKLTHFTGAGVGSATDADRAAQQARVPAGSDAQWEQRFAEVKQQVREAHEARTDGTDPETAAKKENAALAQAAAVALAYLRDVVVPRMRAALAGDTTRTGLTAVQDFVTAARQLQLLGVGDEQAPTMAMGWDLVDQIFAKMIPDAHHRCVTEHDPGMALFMLAAERARELLGAGESPMPAATMNKCLRFEVDFDFLAYGDAWSDDERWGTAWSHHLRALEVPVQIDVRDPETKGTGSAPEEYVAYTGSYSDRELWDPPGDADPIECVDTASADGTLDGTFRVLDLDLDLNYYRDDSADGTPFRLRMRIDPGQAGLETSPRDITRYTTTPARCPQPSAPTITNWWWALYFFVGHVTEAADAQGSSYLIKDWTVGPSGSDVLATKTYDHQLGGDAGNPRELTSLVLRHTPAP